jgi:hypothetical protein
MKTTRLLGILVYLFFAITTYFLAGFSIAYCIYVGLMTIVLVKFLFDNRIK